jgi:hypothetical protein
LSVPDEGYDFERTWWRLWLWAYLMKVMTLSIPDEGYDFERTWWRLWLWAYLMKVMTLSVPDEGYSRIAPSALSWYLRFYYSLLYSNPLIFFHPSPFVTFLNQWMSDKSRQFWHNILKMVYFGDYLYSYLKY